MKYELSQVKKRVKDKIEEDRDYFVARSVEAAALVLLGDSNFVYAREAACLAVVDLDALQKFVDKIAQIRLELKDAYRQAGEEIFSDPE